MLWTIAAQGPVRATLHAAAHPLPMVTPHTFAADALFAKTPLGAEEIQQRTLRLSLLLRRVLLLVDGKRSVADLAPLTGGADVTALLAELLDRHCIEAVARTVPGAPAGTAAPAATDPLAALPPPVTRTAEQVDMARHFMINTINRLLEQNSRLTLVEKIFNAIDAAELRSCYADWEAAIGSSWQGRRRLDELRAKLFAVL
jgi:hypothetical protein